MSSTFFPLIELFNRGGAVELEVAELTRYFNYSLDVPITVKRHFNYSLDIPVSVKRHVVDSLDVAINVKRHFAFSTDFEVDETPTGVVYPFAGPIANIPAGYLLCNGASLVRASYTALFAAIGTIYGAADGSHFNIPDYRDKMMIGATQDDSGIPKTNVTGGLTASGGNITLTHSNGAVTRGTSGVTVGNHADHIHSGPASHTSVSNKQGSSTGSVVTTNTHGNTGNPTATLTHSVTEPNAGAGHDHGFTQPNNHTAIPPYFAVVYMIKT
ncbi:MAG: phage tail protein [Candidatus Bathyarchaeia archaeon]